MSEAAGLERRDNSTPRLDFLPDSIVESLHYITLHYLTYLAQSSTLATITRSQATVLA